MSTGENYCPPVCAPSCPPLGTSTWPLTDVTVVDESVLGLIALGYRHAHRAGGTLSILTEDPLLIRKLCVSGLDRMVPRYAALSEVPGTVS